MLANFLADIGFSFGAESFFVCSDAHVICSHVCGQRKVDVFVISCKIIKSANDFYCPFYFTS